jgi:hypothetical protein
LKSEKRKASEYPTQRFLFTLHTAEKSDSLYTMWKALTYKRRHLTACAVSNMFSMFPFVHFLLALNVQEDGKHIEGCACSIPVLALALPEKELDFPME